MTPARDFAMLRYSVYFLTAKEAPQWQKQMQTKRSQLRTAPNAGLLTVLGQ